MSSEAAMKAACELWVGLVTSDALLSGPVRQETMAQALDAFAQQAREEEREACAKIAEKQRKAWNHPGGSDSHTEVRQQAGHSTAQEIRDQIRARAKEQAK